MQPEVAVPPQEDEPRSRDELQRAHDILRCLLTTEELRDALLDGDGMAFAVNSVDVLCWALHHHYNPAFGYSLMALENCMRNMGCNLRELPEIEYPGGGVPPIELLGNLLAEARMEITGLKKTIAELRGERQ